MVTRRPSSSQFKRTSRQVRQATIKSQLPSESSSIYSRKKKFSDTRRARTAQRGEIHQVLPSTSTRESRRAYENRIGQRDYLKRSVDAGRRRKAVIGIALAIVVLVVAGVAASFVYIGNIDSRLCISDGGALSEVLAPAEDGQTDAADGVQDAGEYTILAASYDNPGAIEAVALVRTDASSGQATVVTMPGAVQLPDGSQTLSDAYAQGGDAALAQAVEEIAGVQAVHYARTDAAGLEGLVDALGGISVTLPAEVSDPDAGDMTLPSGFQTINGQQALFLCRANDFDQPDDGRAAHMAQVAAGMLSKASALDGIGYYLDMDKIADCLKTDMDVRALGSFVKSLRGLELGSVMSGAMPVQSYTSDGARVVTMDEDAWTTMMERVKQGRTPKESLEDVVASVDGDSFSITVNNGGGVEGAAAEAANLLEEGGLKVSSVGNANMQVYDETLVIYKEEKFEQQANAVVALLGHGRAVWDSIHYTFDTDILVVVGSDWGADEEGVTDAAEGDQGDTAASGTDSGATDGSTGDGLAEGAETSDVGAVE